MMFKKAERKQVNLKLAITGPSGSGKTYSALKLARGLVGPDGKIAVIDTENGSAELYSHVTDFDVLGISAPFEARKFTEAIQAAEKAGYSALIIDSGSHIWAGEGGLLSKKESLDSLGKGNSYTNWATITKEFENFKSKMLQSKIHLIFTMRSKMDYIQTEENGRKIIKKVGMAPIQRDGIEFEFTTVFDVGMSHEFTVSKDRTGIFDGRIEKVTEKTGQELLAWLNSGKAMVDDVTSHHGELYVGSPQQVAELKSIFEKAGITEGKKELHEKFKDNYSMQQIREELIK